MRRLAGGLAGLAAAGVALVVVVVLGVVAALAAIDRDDDQAATAGQGSCLVQGLPAGSDAVADLTPVQTRNARIIVATGLELGVPTRGLIVALATALQEAGLKNLASRANPGSLAYPHDGVAAGDHDSVGMFQQRDAWGSLADRMDVAKSTRMFFTGGAAGQRGLLAIPGWELMDVWRAAQETQVSAYPMAYAKWTGTATAAVEAITGGATVECSAVPAAGGAAGGDGSVVLAMPEGSFREGSGYGWRIHPIQGIKKHHNGEDFPAPTGTPTFSIMAGKVTHAGRMGTYGNVIFVDHAGGIQSRYAHLSAMSVRVGQTVTAGARIGSVGNTGGSTGAHLHLEVRLNGNPTDPIPWACDRGLDYGLASTAKEAACS